MSGGLNLPSVKFTTTNAGYSPTGSSGDPLSGAIKNLPSTIVGKLKGLWQSIRGNAKPERSVIDAGAGDYRLQRKGQTGYERLNVIGKVAAQPRATYASPEGARVRVLPSASGVAGVAAGPGAAASGASSSDLVPVSDGARLTALTDRILHPAPAPAAARPGGSTVERLIAQTAQRAEKEAALLADLDQLVRLSASTGESLRPHGGEAVGEAARAFDVIVGKLLRSSLGVPGVLYGKVAESGRGGEALKQAVASLGDSVLALHRGGMMGSELLKTLGDFQPLRTWANSDKAGDQASALKATAEILAALTRGNPAIVNLLTAGDSRRDALALKLKTFCLPEGSPARQKATMEHTLSRAKQQLAEVWTQQEKVKPFGTRTGMVINQGGSDQLRVNAQLLRVLREGPAKDIAAREAGARQGAGIQPSASAGKDVNLLIAQVMLLQKHLDAQDVGDKVQTSKDTLTRRISALSPALQAKLGGALAGPDLPAAERPGVIAHGLSTPATFALLKQAEWADRQHSVAVDTLMLITVGSDLTSADTARANIAADRGIDTALIKDMKAVEARAPAGSPPSLDAKLTAVIEQRAQAATTARQQLADALGCDELAAMDIEHLRKPLDGIMGVKAAELSRQQIGEDSALGLRDKDFMEMGFSLEETAQVKADLSAQLGHPIEDLFHQGLASTADAKKVTDAVNNGIDRLFVKGTSTLTQNTMRDLAAAFPETQARKYLAAVLDIAHPVVGTTAQASANDVFGGIFGDKLSAPDKPLSRLLQQTGSQVAEAQARLATLVGELATLDTGAAAARRDIAGIAPARKIDVGSDSAKVNATRLSAASDTLAALDVEVEALAASTRSLDTHIAQAAGERHPLQVELAGAARTLSQTTENLAAMETRVREIDRELLGATGPTPRTQELEDDRAVIQARLAPTRASQTEQTATVQRLTTSLAMMDEGHAATLAERQADVASRTQTRDGLQTKLDEQIKTLRWMSQTSLATSRLPQDRITNPTQLRAFLALPDNRTAISALHTLHGLPGAKEGKLQQITEHAAQADRALEAHRAVLAGGIDPGKVDSAIRYAVLETALAWPDGPGNFDPVEHRGAIEARLQEFGLDSSVLRPEIDAVLHQKLDLANVDSWTKDTEKAFGVQARPAPGVARRALDAARTFVTDSSPLDAGTRRSLLDGVRSMHVGDSLGLSRGLSWNLDTTPTPVEATGVLTAQIAVDIKSRNALEIRRTEAGVEIVFKAGMEGAGSLGVGATLFGAAKLNATASGGRESLAGAGFRFDSVEAAAKFLDTVLDGKKISPRTWALAKETAVVSDRATTLGGQVDAKATAKNVIAKIPGSAVVMKHLMFEGEVGGSGFDFLGGAQAKLGASAEWRTVQQQNASGHVIEKSRSTTVEGSVSVGIWASLPTVQDSVIDQFVDANPVYAAIDDAVNRNTMMSGAPQDAFGAGAKDYGGPDNHVFDPFSPASSKLLSLNLSAKRTLTESTSLAFERDGMLSASGNTMTRSVVITGKASERDLALVQPGFSSDSAQTRGEDALFNALAKIRAGGPDGASQKMLDELLASAGPGSSLSVTYALKDEARQAVNDLIKSSEHAEKAGDLDGARVLGALAKSMYEDEKNYDVDTIQVSKKTSVDNSTTLASIGIMAVGRVSEGSAERPTMILAMPGGPTARGMAIAPPPGSLPPAPASASASASGLAADLAPEAAVDLAPVSADSGEPVVSDAPLALAGDAIHTDATSSASAPAVLVNVDALQVQAEAVQLPASIPVVRPAQTAWNQRLVERFEAAELPALEPVPRGRLYVENQVSSACGIHSINAFVGGQAFDGPSFTAWARDSTDAFMAVSEQQALGLARETTDTGFSPDTVTRALTLIQHSPAASGKAWEIGSSICSATGATERLGRLTLPNLADTDRVIVEVQVTTSERQAVGAHALDHFVAFRKDDQGAWWLLDSRSAEVDAPLDVDGNRGARSRQIEPEAWLNEIATHAKLKAVTLIGPGITGGDLSGVVTTTQPVPR